METRAGAESLASFAQRNASLGADEFVAAHPHAFLLVELRGSPADDGASDFQTIVAQPSGDEADPEHEVAPRPTVNTERRTRPQSFDHRSEKLVIPLVKANVNSFASMITVGRAANNDVRLNVSSVSKFHAYFMHVKTRDAWLLVDASSSNGTWVSGEKLAPTTRRELQNGDALRFGPDAEARFFDAKVFFELIKSGSK